MRRRGGEKERVEMSKEEKGRLKEERGRDSWGEKLVGNRGCEEERQSGREEKRWTEREKKCGIEEDREKGIGGRKGRREGGRQWVKMIDKR